MLAVEGRCASSKCPWYTEVTPRWNLSSFYPSPSFKVAWSVQSHWVAAHFVVLERAPECTSLRSNLWYQELAPCHLASGIDWIPLKLCHSVLQRPANRKSWDTRHSQIENVIPRSHGWLRANFGTNICINLRSSISAEVKTPFLIVAETPTLDRKGSPT